MCVLVHECTPVYTPFALACGHMAIGNLKKTVNLIVGWSEEAIQAAYESGRWPGFHANESGRLEQTADQYMCRECVPGQLEQLRGTFPAWVAYCCYRSLPPALQALLPCKQSQAKCLDVHLHFQLLLDWLLVGRAQGCTTEPFTLVGTMPTYRTRQNKSNIITICTIRGLLIYRISSNQPKAFVRFRNLEPCSIYPWGLSLYIDPVDKLLLLFRL